MGKGWGASVASAAADEDDDSDDTDDDTDDPKGDPSRSDVDHSIRGSERESAAGKQWKKAQSERRKNSERDFYFSCSLLSRSAHFLSPQLLLLPHTHCSFHFQYVLSGREECPRQNSSVGFFFSGQKTICRFLRRNLTQHTNNNCRFLPRPAPEDRNFKMVSFERVF